jgi:hypothetical protein
MDLNLIFKYSDNIGSLIFQQKFKKVKAFISGLLSNLHKLEIVIFIDSLVLILGARLIIMNSIEILRLNCIRNMVQHGKSSENTVLYVLWPVLFILSFP